MEPSWPRLGGKSGKDWKYRQRLFITSNDRLRIGCASLSSLTTIYCRISYESSHRRTCHRHVCLPDAAARALKASLDVHHQCLLSYHTLSHIMWQLGLRFTFSGQRIGELLICLSLMLVRPVVPFVRTCCNDNAMQKGRQTILAFL